MRNFLHHLQSFTPMFLFRFNFESDTRRRKRYAKSDLVNEGLHLPVKRNSLWLLVFWKWLRWEELWSGVISTFAQRLNWLFYVLRYCSQVRFCVAFSCFLWTVTRVGLTFSMTFSKYLRIRRGCAWDLTSVFSFFYTVKIPKSLTRMRLGFK